MRVVVLAYAILLLISLLATLYTMWAYHHCPQTRSHKPLIFPMMCSIAWFLVAIDQLVAVKGKYHGSVDGASLVALVAITVLALLYFVKAYTEQRSTPCPIPHLPREH